MKKATQKFLFLVVMFSTLLLGNSCNSLPEFMKPNTPNDNTFTFPANTDTIFNTVIDTVNNDVLTPTPTTEYNVVNITDDCKAFWMSRFGLQRNLDENELYARYGRSWKRSEISLITRSTNKYDEATFKKNEAMLCEIFVKLQSPEYYKIHGNDLMLIDTNRIITFISNNSSVKKK